MYTSPDSHLWRELFLTTWDDPRPALEHRALIDPRVDPVAWDWGIEYRRRVSADRWLKAWRRGVCLADVDGLEPVSLKMGRHRASDADADKVTNAEWYPTTLASLSAVLDTLMTLRPFPASPPIALTVLTPAISPYPTGNVGSGVGDQRERMTGAPPLPPLLIVLASGFSGIEVSRSGVRVGRMVYGPHASVARALVDGGEGAVEGTSTSTSTSTPTVTQAQAQASALKPIPTPSLPPQLVRMLLASRAIGVRGLPAYVPHLSSADYWASDPLGDVFHHIVCITGFVPIAPPLDFPSAPTPGSDSDRTLFTSLDSKNGQHDENEMDAPADEEKSGARVLDDPPMGRISKAFPTPSQQYADARTLARRRVYDMRYLRGERLWGPFQLVTRESLHARPGASTLNVDRKVEAWVGETRSSTGSSASSRRGLQHLNTLAWAMGADIDRDDLDSTSDDDSGDEDWHDPAEASQETPSSSQGRHRDGEQVTGTQNIATTEDTDDDAETKPERSLISLVLASSVAVDPGPTTTSTSTESTTSRRRTRRSNPRLPADSTVSARDIKPEHLRPDYAYLASVRIVVEANLRELFESKTSGNVEMAASGSRVGGVGMFWEDEDEILRAGAGSSEQGKLFKLLRFSHLVLWR